ncbi:hypothetical protein SRS16CHR_00141 [Variovorax sp. SRS16]|uniref:hypothetical protein n=1 Tax=Variovorax sp. SRS16 TaxID=282217 RepID=UPI0013172CD7|nr:hypothetical protein [Variovorax sp. SRS16]VTU12902.1 hypothetical protein SRS16CHR_00141 [Variovorax sp. SRS16]
MPRMSRRAHRLRNFRNGNDRPLARAVATRWMALTLITLAVLMLLAGLGMFFR